MEYTPKICTTSTSTSGAGRCGKYLNRILPNGSGVVSFISASSYLDGLAFSGMRKHMRKICDEIWIIDLGGEGRGTRQSDNVIAIQTPVAIAIAIRTKAAELDKPAIVHYACIEGSRTEKLAKLDSIDDFDAINWQNCPNGWKDPFKPKVKNSKYFSWPLLTDPHAVATFRVSGKKNLANWSK